MVKYMFNWLIVVFVSVRVTNAFSHSSHLVHLNALKSSCRTIRVISDMEVLASTEPRERVHGRFELDSHADTVVAGSNCIVLRYTNCACTVLPYNENEYKAISGVPIATVGTGHTSKNGSNYILVLNEALSMPQLDHTLVNPNQLRHYACTVNDNPYDAEPMFIENSEGTFVAVL